MTSIVTSAVHCCDANQNFAHLPQSFDTVRKLHAMCAAAGKVLVVYLSMAFGNPYGEPYDDTVVDTFVAELAALNVEVWLRTNWRKFFHSFSAVTLVSLINPEAFPSLCLLLFARSGQLGGGAIWEGDP